MLCALDTMPSHTTHRKQRGSATQPLRRSVTFFAILFAGGHSPAPRLIIGYLSGAAAAARTASCSTPKALKYWMRLGFIWPDHCRAQAALSLSDIEQGPGQMVAQAQTKTNRRNALTHNLVNGWGCILVPRCSSLAANEPSPWRCAWLSHDSTSMNGVYQALI